MILRRIALLAALCCLGPAHAIREDYGPALNARIFDRAWGIVGRRYWNRDAVGARWEGARARYRDAVVAAPDRRTVYALIGEMLDTLGDSHVYVIDPRRIAIDRARESGRAAAGFGFDMLPDDDRVWRVLAVRPGGAAAAAGVEIGWEVAAVDGRPVDVDLAARPGVPARFDFVDEAGHDHSLSLMATMEAAVPSRRAARLPGDMLLLALDGFDRGDDRWLADRIAAAPPPSAVILDLRGNGGGDADIVARVGGLFFAEDRLLVRRVAARESDQTTRSAGPRAWAGPLAVLVGPNSASGAEAIAALIDESGRGVTVGERTAGALTGAADYDLPDGGIVSVAEFDIRTPSGRRLEGQGLTPRVPVTASLADRRAGRDPVLDRARALLAREVAAR